MANITNAIEEFLLRLLHSSPSGSIEIQRSEVADLFSCAPSQINYVLQTRFAPERGFLVESRRGGGGYIRLTILDSPPADIWQRALEYCADELVQESAAHIIDSLYRAELITYREARLMLAVMDRRVLRIELPWRDKIRSSVLRAMLETIMTSKEDE